MRGNEKNMAKKLGIIGGLGPLATAVFYRKIVEKTVAGCDQDHIETFIYSNTKIPKRVEYILGEQVENPLFELINTAEILEKMGADILVMPCITAHYFYPKMQEAVNIPIIDGVSEIADFLRKNQIKRIGLLATKATIDSNFLQQKFEKLGIETILTENQEKISDIIFKHIKIGDIPDGSCFENIKIELSEKGAQRILIACTDLSLIPLDEKDDKIYLDVMDILADAAVKKCKRE